MPTAKNGFQILNLHPENIELKEKDFLGGICKNFTDLFENV